MHLLGAAIPKAIPPYLVHQRPSAFISGFSTAVFRLRLIAGVPSETLGFGIELNDEGMKRHPAILRPPPGGATCGRTIAFGVGNIGDADIRIIARRRRWSGGSKAAARSVSTFGRRFQLRLGDEGES